MAETESQHTQITDADGDNQDVRMHAALDAHGLMLDGIVRLGKVISPADGDPEEPGDIPRVLVQIGGTSVGSYVRNWLPWTTPRAGLDGEWWAPEPDEQVVVIAPSGNLARAIIIGAIFRGALNFVPSENGITPHTPLPAGDAEKQQHVRVYRDGSRMMYDRNTHTLTMDVMSAADSDKATRAQIIAEQAIAFTAGTTKVTISQDGAVEINAEGQNINLIGNIKVTGTLDVS